ncbi:LLM class F420-dependent oxidoreductase [soil metagenome]
MRYRPHAMAHPRKFRFGVQLATTASAEEWIGLAQRAEALGYSSVLMPDHFGDQLAPVPALMAAADATTELRVGALVFDNDYKHPVVLAKEAATIDVLSGGRLELGLGAGWMASDYEQSGIVYDPPRVRVDRMEEAIAVLKGLFADGRCNFRGEHYQISDLDGLPKPTQRPHPPLLIGAGAPRMLSIAAQHADIVGINPSIHSGEVDADAARDGTAGRTDEKVAQVRSAAGERYADLELNMLIFAAMLSDDRAALREQMAPLFGLEPDGLGDYPHAWFGTAEQIADDLRARRDRWDVSYLVVQGPDAMEAMAPVVAILAGT